MPLLLRRETEGSTKQRFCIDVNGMVACGYHWFMRFKSKQDRFDSGTSILQECEETILGYERMPPRRLLDQSGWHPDERDDYCGQCGHSRVNHGGTCGWNSATAIPCSHVVRLGGYQNPLSAWVREFKFGQWLSMGEQLGQLLGVASSQLIARSECVMNCVVPVPMPFMRRYSRGIDHAEVLAKAVAKQTGLPIRRLVRQRSGPSQVSGRSGGRRRRPNPFQPSLRGKLTKGENILLVDDVLTTGSTCRAMCQVLRSMGCGRIVFAVLAVSE